MNYRRKFIASKEEVIGLLRSGFTKSEVAKHYRVPKENIDYYVKESKRGNGSGEFVCEVCNKAFERQVSLNGHMAATGHISKAYAPKLPINDKDSSEEKIMSTLIQGLQNAVMGYKKIPELEEEITELRRDSKELLSANHQLADERNRWKFKAESSARRQVEIQQILSKPN